MLLDSKHPKRASITSRIAGYNTLIILSCLLAFAWLMHTQLQWSVTQQADALGSNLLKQTHTATEGALSAEDTLSVAVLLRDLVDNPYVAYAALQSTDNRVLAEAGQRPKLNSAEPGLYSKKLFYQDNAAGSLHLQIDLHKLREPLNISMQSMAALGLALLLCVLFLSIHLGRSVAQPLQALSNWLINPVPPAPHTQRADEVGLLARQLNKYFIADTQTTDPLAIEPTRAEEDVAIAGSDVFPVVTTDDKDQQGSAKDSTRPNVQLGSTETTPTQPAQAQRSAILAVELGSMEQLRQLPQEHLAELLKKYRHAVEQSAALYDGQLYSLADGRSMITFPSNHAHYPRNALCCGELLRAFGHNLQMDVSDQDIPLKIKLGLSESTVSQDASLGELLLSQGAQTALALSQQSRNLLLLSEDLASNSNIIASARIRSIAKPEHAKCLEALNEPYPALLEEQLISLQQTELS